MKQRNERTKSTAFFTNNSVSNFSDRRRAKFRNRIISSGFNYLHLRQKIVLMKEFAEYQNRKNDHKK